MVNISNLGAWDTAMSISAWVYDTGGTVTQYIVTKNDGGDGWGTFYIRSAKQLGFNRDGATDMVSRSVETISGSTWTHVLATWDGTFTDATTVHLYINGTEVTYGLQTNGASIVTNAQNWHIGQSGEPLSPFSGSITEVATWNRVLTSGEIASLYNSGSFSKGIPNTIATPVMYLAMDDGTVATSADGDTVADSSGNGNNGTGDDGANNTGLMWSSNPTVEAQGIGVAGGQFHWKRLSGRGDMQTTMFW